MDRAFGIVCDIIYVLFWIGRHSHLRPLQNIIKVMSVDLISFLVWWYNRNPDRFFDLGLAWSDKK